MLQVLRALVHRFQWVHLGVGMTGNLCFFIGSVFFLYESLKTAGIWLFIIGAFGMLIGSVGSAIVKYETDIAQKI